MPGRGLRAQRRDAGHSRRCGDLPRRGRGGHCGAQRHDGRHGRRPSAADWMPPDSATFRSCRTRSSMRRRSTAPSATRPTARPSSATARPIRWTRPTCARPCARRRWTSTRGPISSWSSRRWPISMSSSRVHDQFPELPMVAYNVSGEYAMLKAAIANGWLERGRHPGDAAVDQAGRGGFDHYVSRAKKQQSGWRDGD